MTTPELILYFAAAFSLVSGIALLVRAKRGRRNMRIGWWHAESQVLRDLSFEHKKKHEGDNRGF